MSATITLPASNPPQAGEAVSGTLPGAEGRRLLGLVQRMMRTGMAMARCVNRIARYRLAGEELGKLAPEGFNPTFTNALVVQAVAWTAALRERLFALRARPALAPSLPKAERGPRSRGDTVHLPENMVDIDDWHDWRELARPWRIGPSGVAMAARKIAGLSDREVVSQICGNLRRAAAQLGADADAPRIAALEATARALCPEPDAACAAEGGGIGVSAGNGPTAWVAGSSPAMTADGRCGGPPPRPPPD